MSTFIETEEDSNNEFSIENQISTIPSELIQYEILFPLPIDNILSYCRINKASRLTCENKEFWIKYFDKLSYRERQDGLMFLAWNGKKVVIDILKHKLGWFDLRTVNRVYLYFLELKLDMYATTVKTLAENDEWLSKWIKWSRKLWFAKLFSRLETFIGLMKKHVNIYLLFYPSSESKNLRRLNNLLDSFESDTDYLGNILSTSLAKDDMRILFKETYKSAPIPEIAMLKEIIVGALIRQNDLEFVKELLRLGNEVDYSHIIRENITQEQEEKLDEDPQFELAMISKDYYNLQLLGNYPAKSRTFVINTIQKSHLFNFYGFLVLDPEEWINIIEKYVLAKHKKIYYIETVTNALNKAYTTWVLLIISTDKFKERFPEGMDEW